MAGLKGEFKEMIDKENIYEKISAKFTNLFLVLSIFIAGCATNKGGPKVLNEDLPAIMAIRTIVSTNSVGLEWDDPRSKC